MQSRKLSLMSFAVAAIAFAFTMDAHAATRPTLTAKACKRTGCRLFRPAPVRPANGTLRPKTKRSCCSARWATPLKASFSAA
jgi:hypothetical protein